jgi:AcrR family transcriptional regulator
MKEEILSTALKQFLKLGIRHTSIQNLVEPLGISTKTFYKYYENKEQLLEDALRLYYSEQYSRFEQFENSQNAAQFLFNMWYHGVIQECRVNRVFFEDLNYYYPEIEKRIGQEAGKKIWTRFKSSIEEGIEGGIFKAGTNADLFLESLSAIYLGITRTPDFKKFRMPMDSIYLNSIAVLIRGICTVESIPDFDKYASATLSAVNFN